MEEHALMVKKKNLFSLGLAFSVETVYFDQVGVEYDNSPSDFLTPSNFINTARPPHDV